MSASRIARAARDLAVRDRGDDAPLQIDWHEGDRTSLRSLFELAEDSDEAVRRDRVWCTRALTPSSQ